MSANDQESLLKALDSHRGWLEAQEGVQGSGVGIGRSGQVCVKVFTNQMRAPDRERILDKLKGLPVELEDIGEVRAY